MLQLYYFSVFIAERSEDSDRSLKYFVFTEFCFIVLSCRSFMGIQMFVQGSLVLKVHLGVVVVVSSAIIAA